MLLSSLLLTLILGVFAILINRDNGVSLRNKKSIALTTFILNFFILLIVVIPAVLFGVYPAPILDAIHY